MVGRKNSYFFSESEKSAGSDSDTSTKPPSPPPPQPQPPKDNTADKAAVVVEKKKEPEVPNDNVKAGTSGGNVDNFVEKKCVWEGENVV